MKLDWKTCLKIGISIFILYLCIHYWPAAASFVSAVFGAALPLIIGCMIAYVINIPMSFYERFLFKKSSGKIIKNIKRPLCMIFAIVTVAAIIAVVVSLVAPQLTSCVQLIIAELPGGIEWVISLLEEYHIMSDDVIDILSSVDWKSRIEQIAGIVTSGIGNVMDTLIKTLMSVFSGIVTALIAIIFAVYLLVGKETLAGQIKKLTVTYLNEKWNKRISYFTEVIDDCFHKYIVGQCTEAVILGVLCTIGMMILKLPYAAMIGALIAFTALIPIAGAYIGAGVGAFMILTVSPIKSLIFLVFILVLQQLEGNLVYPKVVGTSIGLPGIWVLAAVTVFGGILGIPGMLLGVPLTSAAYRMIRDDIRKRQGETANVK